MQSYVTFSGLILLVLPLATAVTLMSLALAAFAPEVVKGWRQVTPGAGYWVASVLSVALASLIGWVWSFVGSSRADGEAQMRIAWWLAFLFAWASCFAAWRILALSRQAIRWRGETVQWSGSAGPVPMTSLEHLQTSIRGYTRASFAGSKVLSIDLAATGADALVERLEDLNGLAPPDRPGEH